MKKLLPLAAIYLALTCPNAKGQAYFVFYSGGNNVLWENVTTGGPIIVAPANSINVAFLFGNGTPQIGASGSPTNTESIANWSNVFNDPNFHFGTNANSSQLAVASSINNGPVHGTFAYNSALSFPVLGTTPGGTYNVFAIAWISAFGATPQLAAASGATFGWSNTFSYQTGNDNGAAELPFTNSGMTPFGIVVPEPSTIFFASLGGISLAVFRRRK